MEVTRLDGSQGPVLLFVQMSPQVTAEIAARTRAIVDSVHLPAAAPTLQSAAR